MPPLSSGMENVLDADDEALDDGERGGHPPYRFMSEKLGGAVYDIHPYHVVRDHGSYYPVGRKEWEHMRESGRHAFWSSFALLDKPSRLLLPKTIVVIRTGFTDPSYVWCVRFKIDVWEFTPKGCKPSQTGRDFLWPLNSELAFAFMLDLNNDAQFVSSSLVQQYAPTVTSLSLDQLKGARRADTLPSWLDRGFVASFNVVSEKKECLGLTAAAGWWRGNQERNLTGGHVTRRSTRVASRRSPRVAGPSLVDVLGRDLLEEVVGLACYCRYRFYAEGTPCELVGVINLRLVCRAFNALVCARIVRTCRMVRSKCDLLRYNKELDHAYYLRAVLVWSAVSVYRAMAEAETVRNSDRALTHREEVHMWMRLFFNKPKGARPPGPVNSMQSMVFVHGQAPRTDSRHGTRRQSQKRVRFRLAAPVAQVRKLELEGWSVFYAPGLECPNGGLW